MKGIAMTCTTGTYAHGDKLEKVRTGIRGLDEITDGGLPRGRTTLVTGGPGSGKSMISLEFLVRGASEYGEPGVFISFEETADEVVTNGASLGFDVAGLCEQGLLHTDYVRVERSEIEETGEYDLEGLFIRLSYAIEEIGAKRVVLDTIESLFAGLPNAAILRAELRRLFRWLKDKGMTTVITAERGKDTLTREGLEEYVSDCVILLDQRVIEQVSTRRLRVVKYRGSKHGTNEYPFLMSDTGFLVLPITSVGLGYTVSTERVSSGLPGLDEMLGGKGFYRGSLVLVSGTAGTGKSSLACTFVEAACRRGERAVHFTFEESPSQIIRNMASIGLDLESCAGGGLLRFSARRPTVYGLEHHLLSMLGIIDEFDPSVVVIDPFSNLPEIGSMREVRAMIQRLVDHMKGRGITSLFTSLTTGQNAAESPEFTEVGISSLADTWLLLRDIELGGERNRGMYIMKSRGMAHSNQIREFLLGRQGIRLLDVYTGPEGVITGSARVTLEARERDRERAIRQKIERLEANMEARRAAMEGKIALVRSDFQSDEVEMLNRIDESRKELESLARQRAAMLISRKAGGLDGRGQAEGTPGTTPGEEG
jgi:circadian clock protein KaiC